MRQVNLRKSYFFSYFQSYVRVLPSFSSSIKHNRRRHSNQNRSGQVHRQHSTVSAPGIGQKTSLRRPQMVFQPQQQRTQETETATQEEDVSDEKGTAELKSVQIIPKGLELRVVSKDQRHVERVHQ